MKDLNDYYTGELPDLEDIYKRGTIFITEYQSLSSSYTDRQLQEIIDAFQGDIHLLTEIYLPQMESDISKYEKEIDAYKLERTSEYNRLWEINYNNYKATEIASASIKLANNLTQKQVIPIDEKIDNNKNVLNQLVNEKRRLKRFSESLSRTSIAIAMRLKNGYNVNHHHH